MSDITKLEIFVKNKEIRTLVDNFRNKYFFQREERINEIIGENIIIKEKNIIFGLIYDELDDNRLINLSKVSHSIHHISNENGKYYGYIKILDTPNGRINNNNIDLLILYPKLIYGEGWVNIRSIDIGHLGQK